MFSELVLLSQLYELWTLPSACPRFLCRDKDFPTLHWIIWQLVVLYPLHLLNLFPSLEFKKSRML